MNIWFDILGIPMSDELPISLREAILMEDAIEHVNHLSDMGITAADCPATIFRYTQDGPIRVWCKRTGGHKGKHDTE